MNTTLLITLSTVIALVSPVIYGISMVNGRSKPARMTRFIVFVTSVISFFSLWQGDGNTAMWLALVFSVRGLGLFIMSLKYGMGGWTNLDKVSLALATAGLIAWQVSSNPLLALLAAIIADLIGSTPSLIKTWKQPNTEGPWFFIMEFIAIGLNALAIGVLSTELLFPAYLLVFTFAMTAIIVFRNDHTQKQQAAS